MRELLTPYTPHLTTPPILLHNIFYFSRDENMKPAQCFLETDIHELLPKLVGPSDPVLEVG